MAKLATLAADTYAADVLALKRKGQDEKLLAFEMARGRTEFTPLQITKAVRIPFVYRQSREVFREYGQEPPPEWKDEWEGRLLLGHIVVGYEGAGST